MTKKKYVRQSKKRFQAYYHACNELTSKWHRVVTGKVPLQPAFAAIQEWIRSLDITLTDRTTLVAKAWALRDYACMHLAHWQLYLDNEKLPNNAVPLGCYPRVTARYNWVNSDLPFYTDEPPKPL